MGKASPTAVFEEPVLTNDIKDPRLYYAALKAHIITYLPAAYGRHTSSNVLKGFSIRLTVEYDYFAAVAIADLGPPTSLVDDEFVLEDEFMEAQSDVSALDALELLFELVEDRLLDTEQGPYGPDVCDSENAP